MNFQLPFSIPPSRMPIRHQDRIMLLGSCFTEHIGGRMKALKFPVCDNPNGILFNPLSVHDSLQCYLQGGRFADQWMFQWQEAWHHWQFHSRFSHTSRQEAEQQMQTSLKMAADFLAKADWLLLTFGSAYQYFLLPGQCGNERELAVANCHRAPVGWFQRRLLPSGQMISLYDTLIGLLKEKMPRLRIILTVSPVRHVREGLEANNRSKARLLELVHALNDKYDHVFYFPAYELVIDVLRDYRFFDIDLVHPNYAATNFVWDHFSKTFFDQETHRLLEEINDIRIAAGHRPRFSETRAHQQFKAKYRAKVKALQRQFPGIDWTKELAYFGA